MFYSEDAIRKLMDRVGWAGPVPPTDIVLSAGNLKSDSLRTFKGYHKLATIEKVYSCIENADLTMTSFQSELEDIKRQAVLKVLSAVFDLNELANSKTGYLGSVTDTSGTDYSNVIFNRANLFDNCIGFQVAYDVLQLQVSTTRSNDDQRAATAAYNALKIELEGITNDDGKLTAKGITYYLSDAIAKTIKILFPQARTSKNVLYNASNKW